MRKAHKVSQKLEIKLTNIRIEDQLTRYAEIFRLSRYYERRCFDRPMFSELQAAVKLRHILGVF